MTTTAIRHEQEIDTQLAQAYNTIQRLYGRRAMQRESLMYAAGCRKRHSTRTKFEWTNYRDYERVTFDEAHERVTAMIADNPGYSDYTANPLNPSSYIRHAQDTLDKLDEIEVELNEAISDYERLESAYTGWSRFFLVTSSRGHIHSSMSCSTCRPTTTYGWLPELSGLTEAEAVNDHGPALCSVCFPSAPVEWVGGWITQAQAERRSA